jgi:hypothetical protein
MKKLIIGFIVFCSFLLFQTVAFAGSGDASSFNLHNDYKVKSVSAQADINGNTRDYCVPTWNFEESAGDSLTSYAKGSTGVVYGWEITGLSSASSGWAKLYDAASIVGSIGEKSELTIDGTYKDSDYRIFPFGVLFSTEIVVQRSSATAVNVRVWYK